MPNELAKPGNRVDDLILRYVDTHSPEEISRLLNGAVTPATVRLRAQQLVSTSDWLTDQQQAKVALLKLRRWLAELEGRYMDESNAKLRLGMLKEIMDRVEKRQKATDHDLTTYHVNVGREMARVYDMALGHMKKALSEKIDPTEWDSAARDALRHAQEELMKKAIGGDEEYVA